MEAKEFSKKLIGELFTHNNLSEEIDSFFAKWFKGLSSPFFGNITKNDSGLWKLMSLSLTTMNDSWLKCFSPFRAAGEVDMISDEEKMGRCLHNFLSVPLSLVG